jgi:hypothetical protein
MLRMYAAYAAAVTVLARLQVRDLQVRFARCGQRSLRVCLPRYLLGRSRRPWDFSSDKGLLAIEAAPESDRLGPS